MENVSSDFKWNTEIMHYTREVALAQTNQRVKTVTFSLKKTNTKGW